MITSHNSLVSLKGIVSLILITIFSFLSLHSVTSQPADQPYLFLPDTSNGSSDDNTSPLTDQTPTSNPIDEILWVMKLEFTFTHNFPTEEQFTSLPQHSAAYQLITQIPSIGDINNLYGLQIAPLNNNTVDYYIPYWYQPATITSSSSSSSSSSSPSSPSSSSKPIYQLATGKYRTNPDEIKLDPTEIQNIMNTINLQNYKEKNSSSDNTKKKKKDDIKSLLPGHIKKLSISLKYPTRASCSMIDPLQTSRYCNIPSQIGAACQMNEDCVSYASCLEKICSHNNVYTVHLTILFILLCSIIAFIM